ncbi:MAG: 2OG-Fe(II) oxygenase family protein [Pseudomonadota bacterium]
MSEVAVVDIASLFGDDPDPATDNAIAGQFATEAAIVVSGFPGSQTLEERVTYLRSFFATPDPVRRRLATRRHEPGNPNLYRGYNPPPVKPHWSYNETFDVGPEPPLPAPDLPSHAAFTEENVWPSDAEMPGWRDAALSYVRDCRAIAAAVIRSTARGLGVDPTEFDVICESENSTLRLLHYPVMPEGFELLNTDGSAKAHLVDGRPTITREHIDTGGLTILWQDDQDGLQMKGRDDVWRDVPTGDGLLSIHCGDLLSTIGGAALAPTPHRVLGTSGERFSIGYFIEPEFMSQVMPPNGAEAKSYGQHLTDAFPTRFLPPGAAAAAG